MISKQEIAEIRKRRSNGESIEAIALEVGRDRATIRKYIPRGQKAKTVYKNKAKTTPKKRTYLEPTASIAKASVSRSMR